MSSRLSGRDLMDWTMTNVRECLRRTTTDWSLLTAERKNERYNAYLQYVIGGGEDADDDSHPAKRIRQTLTADERESLRASLRASLRTDDHPVRRTMAARFETLLQFRNDHKGSLGWLGNVEFLQLSDFFDFAQEHTPGPFVITPSPETRIVAIGDIHGDFVLLLTLLRLANLIDDDGCWIGRNAICVQCGDLVDRVRPGSGAPDTPHVREEIDLLQYIHGLDRDARRNGGGRVIALLGNHEFASMDGTRDLEYRKFISPNQATGWEMEAFGEYQDRRDFFDVRRGGPMGLYMTHHRPLVAVVGNHVFLHGGDLFADRLQGRGLNVVHGINRLASTYFNQQPPDRRFFDEIMMPVLFGRELANMSEQATCSNRVRDLFALLELDYDRGGLIVGHTQPDEPIRGLTPNNCQFKLWKIDYAMSRAFVSDSNPLAILQVDLRRQTLRQSLWTNHEGESYKHTQTYGLDGTLMYNNRRRIIA